MEHSDCNLMRRNILINLQQYVDSDEVRQIYAPSPIFRPTILYMDVLKKKKNTQTQIFLKKYLQTHDRAKNY